MPAKPIAAIKTRYIISREQYRRLLWSAALRGFLMMVLPMLLIIGLSWMSLPLDTASEAFARGLSLGVASAVVMIFVGYVTSTAARYGAAFVGRETLMTVDRQGVSVEIPGETRQVFHWRSFSGFQETRSSFVLLSPRYPRRHVWKRFFTADEQARIRAWLKWHVGRDEE